MFFQFCISLEDQCNSNTSLSIDKTQPVKYRSAININKRIPERNSAMKDADDKHVFVDTRKQTNTMIKR